MLTCGRYHKHPSSIATIFMGTIVLCTSQRRESSSARIESLCIKLALNLVDSDRHLLSRIFVQIELTPRCVQSASELI